MHDLQLVGFTTDRRGLIFRTTTGARPESYVVPVTDELVALLRSLADAGPAEGAPAAPAGVPDAGADGAGPGSSRRAPRAESQLSVREIQARLRAGEDVARVAREAGVDDAWIERFAPPVRAEQRRIVERALASSLERPRAGVSVVPLRRAVGMALADRGIAFTAAAFDAAWSSRLVGHDRWAVEFRYRHRGKERTAVWDFDATDGSLTTADRTASQLGFVGADGHHDPDAGTVIDGVIGDPDATPIGTAPSPPRRRTTAKRSGAVESTATTPDAQKASAKRTTKKASASTRKAAATPPGEKASASTRKAAATPAGKKASASTRKAAATPAGKKASASTRKAATTAPAPRSPRPTTGAPAGLRRDFDAAAANGATPSGTGPAAGALAPERPTPNGAPTSADPTDRLGAAAEPDRGAPGPVPSRPAPDARRATVRMEPQRGAAGRSGGGADPPSTMRSVGSAPPAPDEGGRANPEELLRLRARRVEERLSQDARAAARTPSEPEADRTAARRARAAERNAHTVQFRSGAAAPVRLAADAVPTSADERARAVPPSNDPRPAPAGDTPAPPAPPVDANGAARPRTRRRRQLRAR